jgi:hypothetical protein
MRSRNFCEQPRTNQMIVISLFIFLFFLKAVVNQTCGETWDNFVLKSDSGQELLSVKKDTSLTTMQQAKVTGTLNAAAVTAATVTATTTLNVGDANVIAEIDKLKTSVNAMQVQITSLMGNQAKLFLFNNSSVRFVGRRCLFVSESVF